MLGHFREQISHALAQVDHLILATWGPAGLQAGRFSCQADGLRLYLRVPGTLDLVQNLRPDLPVIATTGAWQAHGRAVVLSREELPPAVTLLDGPQARWDLPIEVQIQRFEKYQPSGWGFQESLDLEVMFGDRR